MMKVELAILMICFLEASGTKSFIKTAKGNFRIMCENNSLFVTNKPIFECNGKTSCLINNRFGIIKYVCIKREFVPSNCHQLTGNEFPEKTGCYVGRDRNMFIRSLPEELGKYFHFLVLFMSLEVKGRDDCFRGRYKGDDHPAISSLMVNSSSNDWLYNGKYLSIDANAWFFLKVSNKSEEDFGDILAGSSMEPAPQTNKTEIFNSTTIATTENNRSATNVSIIMVVVVIVLLIIIFLMAGFIFYRHRKSKRTQNTETANRANEIPQGKNGDNNDYDVISPLGENKKGAKHNNEYGRISGAVKINQKKIKNSRPVGPKYPSSVHMNMKGSYQATTSGNKERNRMSEDIYVNQNEISDCPMDPEYIYLQ